MTVTTSDVYYDPYDREILADPYPYFRRLRDAAPLYYNERYDFWAVSRFADVEAALIDKNTFSNEKGVLLDIVKADIEMPPGTLIHEQDPSHAIHRQLLSRVLHAAGDVSDRARRYGASARNASTSWSAATRSTWSPSSPSSCR